MSRTKTIILKLTSWFFRLVGIGCIVFGIWFFRQAAISRSVNDYYNIVPELYLLILVGSIFIPCIAGLFAFIISALIDLRVAISRSNTPVVQAGKQS